MASEHQNDVKKRPSGPRPAPQRPPVCVHRNITIRLDSALIAYAIGSLCSVPSAFIPRPVSLYAATLPTGSVEPAPRFVNPPPWRRDDPSAGVRKEGDEAGLSRISLSIWSEVCGLCVETGPLLMSVFSNARSQKTGTPLPKSEHQPRCACSRQRGGFTVVGSQVAFLNGYHVRLTTH